MANDGITELPLSTILTVALFCNWILTIALDGLASGAPENLLFAGETQRRTAAALHSAQPRLLAADVVARDRNHALALAQLQLEHHHPLFAEGHLGSRQIKLPHPHEALVIGFGQIVPMSKEAFAPLLQCFRVVQAQDFNIG